MHKVMCARCDHHLVGHHGTEPKGDWLMRLIQELASGVSHGAWVPDEEPCRITDCTCHGFVLNGHAMVGSYVHVGAGLSLLGEGFEVKRYDEGGIPRVCQECREPIPPENGRFAIQCMALEDEPHLADEVPTFVVVTLCVGCLVSWALNGDEIREGVAELRDELGG